MKDWNPWRRNGPIRVTSSGNGGPLTFGISARMEGERGRRGYLCRDENKGKEEREVEKGGKDRVGYGVNAIRNIHTFSISHVRPDKTHNRRLMVLGVERVWVVEEYFNDAAIARA